MDAIERCGNQQWATRIWRWNGGMLRGLIKRCVVAEAIHIVVVTAIRLLNVRFTQHYALLWHQRVHVVAVESSCGSWGSAWYLFRWWSGFGIRFGSLILEIWLMYDYPVFCLTFASLKTSEWESDRTISQIVPRSCPWFSINATHIQGGTLIHRRQYSILNDMWCDVVVFVELICAVMVRSPPLSIFAHHGTDATGCMILGSDASFSCVDKGRPLLIALRNNTVSNTLPFHFEPESMWTERLHLYRATGKGIRTAVSFRLLATIVVRNIDSSSLVFSHQVRSPRDCVHLVLLVPPTTFTIVHLAIQKTMTNSTMANTTCTMNDTQSSQHRCHMSSFALSCQNRIERRHVSTGFFLFNFWDYLWTFSVCRRL
jgi:hypothetical protein